MRSLGARLTALIGRLSAVALVMAIVIVPTVMRSRQHVELHDTTRLSIRLNWQSGTPPQKVVVEGDRHVVSLIVPSLCVVQPLVPRVLSRIGDREAPIPPPIDDAPDLFRGPPPSVLS